MSCFYGRDSRTRACIPILHSTTGQTQAHLLRHCGPFPCQQQPRPCHPTHSRHGLASAFTLLERQHMLGTARVWPAGSQSFVYNCSRLMQRRGVRCVAVVRSSGAPAAQRAKMRWCTGLHLALPSDALGSHKEAQWRALCLVGGEGGPTTKLCPSSSCHVFTGGIRRTRA